MSEKKIGRFLFIGLGGSGGKTLQYLYNNLEIKLASVNKSMPEGWQFLWIDVPQEQDALDTGTGVKPLSDKFYLPLTQPGATFNKFDYSLRRKYPAIQNHLAQWSPDATKIKTKIIDGAGQFRAIGRIVTMKSYQNIQSRISDILSKMEDAKVLAELEEINDAINPNPDGEISSFDKKPPMVIFVSSLAGGSGSGSTVDVADIVRSVVDNSGIYPDQSVGILYTPDIFLGEKDLQGNSTIYANSLFAICEIISGWHDSDEIQPDSDIWKAYEMLPPSSRRRGPRYNFLIGRGNKKITFSEPIDIFRNTGKLIAEWCLNPNIDSELRAFVLTNWENQSSDQPTNTGISKNLSDNSKPFDCFNSLGYSSVSLGREYFRKYSEERIAKLAIKHLVRAHWDKDTGRNKTDEKALSEQTERVLKNEFLYQNSGLLTKKKNENNIQSKISSPQTNTTKALYAEKIFNFATSDNQQRTINEWVDKFTSSFNNHKEQFIKEIEKEHIKNAQNWVKNFNVEFVNFVSDTVAEFGAPVTLNFVNNLTSYINNALNNSENGLLIEQSNNQKWANNYSKYFEEKLNPIGSASIGKENNVMSEIKVQINKSLQYFVSESIAKIVSDLINSVRDEVLPEIRTVLRDMISKGNTNLDESIEGGYGKVVALWPDTNPTDAVENSENEVLVEDTSEYVEKFQELVNRTYKDEARQEDAINLLYKKVLRGNKVPDDIERITNEQELNKILNGCLITIEKAWRPELSYLNNGKAPEPPKYKMNIDIYSIKNRATKILLEQGNPFGTYITESLNDYLNEENCSSHEEYLKRQIKFLNAFREALSYAQPQLSINSALNENVHGNIEENVIKLSPIDIEDKEITEILIQEMLPYFNNKEEEVRKKFTRKNSNLQSIKFYSHFQYPFDIVVVKSLWKPFIEKWNQAKSNNQSDELTTFWLHRRARPLKEFIPLHPEIIDSLIKGYFIARLMKIYKTNRDQLVSNKINLVAEIEVEDFGYLKFPEPLVEPQPKKQDELGSLLLSLPIAIGLVSTDKNKDALKPYEKLIELGLNQQGSAGSNGLSLEFLNFLKKQSDEEIVKIIDQLTIFLNSFKKITSRSIYSSNLDDYERKPGVSWELAPSIIKILQSVITSIKKLEQEQDEIENIEGHELF